MPYRGNAWLVDSGRFWKILESGIPEWEHIAVLCMLCVFDCLVVCAYAYMSGGAYSFGCGIR